MRYFIHISDTERIKRYWFFGSSGFGGFQSIDGTILDSMYLLDEVVVSDKFIEISKNKLLELMQD